MSDEDRRRSPDREDDGYGDKQSAGSNGRRTPPNDNDRDDRGGGGRGGAAEAAADDRRGKGDAVIGSASLRPVFLGNLDANFRSDDVIAIFERPVEPPNASMRFAPIAVDRIDVKRGYCFVFLKDVSTQAEKEQAERFVQEINGMRVQYVSPALRVEFARGDGRVKRKEDERRRNIEPSDTLFVVNFNEQTTRRSDLEMLFEPFGDVTRIDMKRNYAFVQFRSVEQATRAKDATNGGKLDQSILTVEYVARQRPYEGGGGGRGTGDHPPRGDRYRGGGGGGGGDYRDRATSGDPSYRRAPPPSQGGYDRRYGDYDDRKRGGGDYHDRPRSRSRDRGGGGGAGGRPYDDYDRGGGGLRDRRDYDRGAGGGPRGRSRSPPPAGGRYDDRDRYGDYRGGAGGGDGSGGGSNSRDRDRRPPSRSPPRYRDGREGY